MLAPDLDTDKLAKPETIVVVGDRFLEFARQSGVVGFGKMEESLAAAAGGSTGVALYLGQGLSIGEIAALRRLFGDSEVLNEQHHVSLVGAISACRPCDPALVHKRHQRNVMISEPVQGSTATTYNAHLMVDDACDEMADHVTGWHLQGTILGEAARQLVLAVSEKYLLPEQARFQMRFVSNATKVTFSGYAFPVDVAMALTVEKMRRGFGGNFSANAAVDFRQNGQAVARAELAFSTFAGSYLDGHEASMAREAVSCLA